MISARVKTFSPPGDAKSVVDNLHFLCCSSERSMVRGVAQGGVRSARLLSSAITTSCALEHQHQGPTHALPWAHTRTRRRQQEESFHPPPSRHFSLLCQGVYVRSRMHDPNHTRNVTFASQGGQRSVEWTEQSRRPVPVPRGPWPYGQAALSSLNDLSCNL